MTTTHDIVQAALLESQARTLLTIAQRHKAYIDATADGDRCHCGHSDHNHHDSDWCALCSCTTFRLATHGTDTTSDTSTTDPWVTAVNSVADVIRCHPVDVAIALRGADLIGDERVDAVRPTRRHQPVVAYPEQVDRDDDCPDHRSYPHLPYCVECGRP